MKIIVKDDQYIVELVLEQKHYSNIVDREYPTIEQQIADNANDLAQQYQTFQLFKQQIKDTAAGGE